MTQSYPLHSLIEGSWFKLICGASYQHLPAVRSLAIAYSLAGADCIDVAADPAVIAAVAEGIKVAKEIQPENQLVTSQRNNVPKVFSLTSTSNNQSPKLPAISPWLMVSINDGEDPHFRKAKFDSTQCPQDCPQPCVQVCPADAIDLAREGVVDSLCYGCGRCLPICPQALIDTRSYISSTSVVVPWIESRLIDAIEIHTQVGHYNDFKRVWTDIAPVVKGLKVLAISCTEAPNVIEYLRSLYELVEPLPCALIWQTDGRSMSGDIGKGTTHAAIAFAQRVLHSKLPGYIQLAGGTNNYTVDKLEQEKMLRQQNPLSNYVSGVAYGSYARTLLSPILAKLETAELHNIQSNLIKDQPMNQLNFKLEQNKELLAQATIRASQLVSQIKTAHG